VLEALGLPPITRLTRKKSARVCLTPVPGAINISHLHEKPVQKVVLEGRILKSKVMCRFGLLWAALPY